MTEQAKVVTEIANDTVRLKHVYQATAEQVYQAWINPDSLGQWFGPHSHTCKVEKLDAREGGDYQLRMTPVVAEHDCAGEEAEDSVCAGKFLKIVPNETIIMTFNWIEGGADMGDTLLTVEIRPTSKGTEVHLIHERIPTEELRQAHSAGWQGTLEGLEEFIETVPFSV